jgi:hypothetical protein
MPREELFAALDRKQVEQQPAPAKIAAPIRRMAE